MATSNTTSLAPVVVTGKRAPPSDDVKVLVAGRVLGGWTDVRITAGIERFPRDFVIGATDPFPSEANAMFVKPGEPCEVFIGSDLVITGYIDRVEPSISTRRHQIRLYGRGKCQDLVDCSYVWPGGQIVGSSVLEIAKKLAKPYGIDVVSIGDMGGPVPQYNLMLGDTPYNVIEVWSRIRQVLVYETAAGAVCLHSATGGQSSFPQAASGFQEGVNIIEAVAMWSAEQRYSEYRVHRMSMEQLKDVGESNLIASHPDKGVERFRRLDMIAENTSELGLINAEDRARWEAARRWGRSGAIQILTDSWRDVSGELYRPGTAVPILAPTLFKGEVQGNSWVISEVSYLKDEGGTTAQITAMSRLAFSPPPTLPPNLIPAEINNLPATVARP